MFYHLVFYLFIYSWCCPFLWIYFMSFKHIVPDSFVLYVEIMLVFSVIYLYGRLDGVCLYQVS